MQGVSARMSVVLHSHTLSTAKNIEPPLILGPDQVHSVGKSLEKCEEILRVLNTTEFYLADFDNRFRPHRLGVLGRQKRSLSLFLSSSQARCFK